MLKNETFFRRFIQQSTYDYMQNHRQINSRIRTLEKELAIKNSVLEIEAALEKVRSRSMAMHHSSDLQEVIKVIAEQFLALGLRFDTTNFGKVLSDGSWDVWISTPNQLYPAQIFIPYLEHPAFIDANKMYASGKDFFTCQYSLEEKNSFFQHFFDNTAAKNIPDERKEYVLSAKGWLRSVFFLKTIQFAVACYDEVPYSDEENRVFKQFAKVFEQAYVRFLDLQKAEVYAKQVETTLLELKSTQAQLIESEKQKLEAHHHTQLLELEAQALRAQMNPHFIFNCMNSIKLLVQKNDQEKAIHYLITFSKLLRIIFENSAKREITLFDELDICKLYIQLESFRFSNRFSYQFNIDDTIDLKSITIPALIMQPFIENAIWHGIMPKEDGGHITLLVTKQNNQISCIIDDNGIGIQMSKQNKSDNKSKAHHSKGMHLTQTRLRLDNLINHRSIGVEIINKKDSFGLPAGTTVIITLNEY